MVEQHGDITHSWKETCVEFLTSHIDFSQGVLLKPGCCIYTVVESNACALMVITVGSEHGDMSSNPGRVY